MPCKVQVRCAIEVIEIMASKEKDVRRKLALETLIEAAKEYSR